MIGYIYKTINLINQKCYIGKHETTTYDSSYLGSGKVLKRAIKKYGKENFSNEIIDIANTIEELNEKEKYYISLYKKEFGNNCYNLANGGDGGNVFKYQTEEVKQNFIQKMTIINQIRCNSSEFKQKLSKATSERYKDKNIREEHAQKIQKVWQDSKLRNEQSKKLKNYYKNHIRDCSFNNISCVFQLQDKQIIFESIKDLRAFLKEEYNYNPDRRTFKKVMDNGERSIPYIPYHKNKFKELKGMLIYKLKNSVETNGDECSQVEQEIDTCPKCETVMVEDNNHNQKI